MAKIAAALIIKDDSEEKELDRALASIYTHVDAIFITGTKKPQQRIKKLCKKYDAIWSWFAWIKDFSAARNFNFSQVPKEYEWILWIDADDVVVGADSLHQAVEVGEQANCKSVFARYLYQVESEDVKVEGLNSKTQRWETHYLTQVKNVVIEHLRERLIKNDGSHKWVAPIHETLIEQYPTGKTDFKGFHVVHMTDFEDMQEAMYRNIDILQEEVIRNPNDPRPIYYLAKAYFDTKAPEILYEPAGEGMDSITIELLKDYIRKSGWKEERSQAWEYLSMIHRERQEYKKSIQCLLEALNEYPLFPSTYIQLALNYVMLKEWATALNYVKLAGQVDIPQTTLVINPKDYKAMILECLYHVYLNTGKIQETEQVAQGLVDLLPSDLNKDRLKGISTLKDRNNLAHWCVKLASHLKQTNQLQQLKALINSIPQEIASEPALVSLRQEMTPPRNWDKDEIAIWCGAGWERWSPKNVAKGIGGSEEAVIYLTKELAKLGWKVTVFADPQEEEGEYEGVRYAPHYTINWEDNFNIFISWRQIWVFDRVVKAKKTYLWNHDIQNAMEYKPERVDRITKIMFLSKWHRDNVPNLSEDKVMITSNGIVL